MIEIYLSWRMALGMWTVTSDLLSPRKRGNMFVFTGVVVCVCVCLYVCLWPR